MDMDMEKLQSLIDAATSARLALDEALRRIERYIGGPIDGMDDFIDTFDAASLLEYAEKQKQPRRKRK